MYTGRENVVPETVLATVPELIISDSVPVFIIVRPLKLNQPVKRISYAVLIEK